MARRAPTLPDLVRTLVVFAVVVGGAVLLVPHNQTVHPAAVDYREPALALAARSPFVPLVPAGLPAGWAANHVRTHTGPDSLDVGFYDAPDHAYLSVHESAAPRGPLLRSLGVGGQQAGTVTAAGRIFQVRRATTGPAHTALVATVPGATVVVGGGAALPLLIDLAGKLQPAEPAAAG